jgi:FkbM family methyltransferase
MLDSRTAPWGDTIWFQPDDQSIEPSFLDCGTAWPHELEAVTSMVRPGDLVVDAGANLGYLTCYFAHLAGPAGEVRAIEPNQAMSSLLHRNITHNNHDTVTIDRLALGPSDATVQLWVSENRRQRHSIHPANVPSLAGSEPVRQVTTDAYWNRYLDRRRIGLLKLDVEGAEYHALRSGPGMLSASREIWMEFWPEGISMDGADAYQCLAILEEAGFALTQWDLETGAHEPVQRIGDVQAAIERLNQSEERRNHGLDSILYIHGSRQARTTS